MISPGTKFGRYTITELLGKGAMGVVYKAFDSQENREVALKMLAEDLAQSTEYRDRLGNEARLNATIVSEHVVRVWESSEIDGQAYIAMEYIPGEELRDAAAEKTFDQKLDILCQIGKGLEAAHSTGLIHRDLKPENIKLTPDGIAKILDFGLARTFEQDAVDDDGNVEGSLYYMAPEQLMGETLTPACDIFSFGTIAYELLCDRRPFEGDYTASVIYSILHEEAIPPDDINENLPQWVSALCSRLLAKRPEDRFESIAQAVKYIEDCRKDGGLAAGAWDKPKQTVTVIDLQNLSGDDSWAYFCEGFTDDVIKELSRRTDLLVSAEPATSHRRNIKEMFQKCRSDFVVAGSLMKWQEKIKLSLSIHGAEGDELVWSETYMEPAENLFELLAQAARETSAALAASTESEPVVVGEDFRPDVSAYDFYLKGKSYYQTNKPEDLAFAEDMFKRALEVDNRLALAHAGLSDVHTFQYMAYYDRSAERIKKAREEAKNAITIDPKLPEAHRSLARYYMFTGNYAAAEQSLLRTVDLNPKYAIGYRTLAWLKQVEGDYRKATRYASRALELSPTDLETLLLLSLLSINQRKFTAAIATLQRAIELGPDYGRAYYYLGMVYLKLGVLEQAFDNFERAAKYKGDPNCHIDAGYVRLLQKEYDSAREQFRLSLKAEYFPFVSHYMLGLTARLMDDSEKANEHLVEALRLMDGYDLKKVENNHVLLYSALAMAALGLHDKSAEQLKNVEKAGKLTADLKLNVARCYSLLGEKEKAGEILKQAIKDLSGPTEKEVVDDPHFTMPDILRPM